MSRDRATIRAERSKIREQYRSIYDDLTALFFQHDPLGIAFVSHPNVQDNPDEYEPEVGTILPRLQKCSTESDRLKVIHEEFCRWFGEDVSGPIAGYKSIATEVWIMWNNQKLNKSNPALS